ncbi:DUF4265 domain-containing protein [Streptosporangium sp. NPDC006013]|uniref:DUF4265 domain-containing protein n=1 Tax=Streptosporangium sp. NPDC006013 TaxID=3155596 RepID=UPI0033B97A3D
MSAYEARHPTGSKERLFKVAFDLPEEASEWPPVSTERLWTEKTDIKFEARVLNTPFFVRGISWGDVIRVRADHARRELVFEEFMAESGHSTAHIILMDLSIQKMIEDTFATAGCSWETSGIESYMAIDIPPATHYGDLRGQLLEMKGSKLIGVQESAISRLHRGQLSEFP